MTGLAGTVTVFKFSPLDLSRDLLVPVSHTHEIYFFSPNFSIFKDQSQRERITHEIVCQ